MNPFIIAFNREVDSLLCFLRTRFPDDHELDNAQSRLHMARDYCAETPLTTFMVQAIKYDRQITDEDEGFFLQLAEHECLPIGRFWKTLSETDKQHIWHIVKTLRLIGQRFMLV